MTPAELMDFAQNDPLPAIDACSALLADPSLTGADRVVARRARGLARRLLGEFVESLSDLETARHEAAVLEDPNLRAGVGVTLAGTLVHLGRVDEAKSLLADCIERSDGRTEADAIYQLGTTHAQAGDLDAALQIYDRALPLIREHGELGWEASLLGNSGTMNIYRGRYDDAVLQLDEAMALLTKIGAGPSKMAVLLNNKAYALHLRGDIAESLDLYEESDRFHEEHGLPTTMFAHKCNAHVAAGMYEETLALANQAHRFHREGNAAVGAIEALLAGADAALALDNLDLAVELAGNALAIDQEGSFPVWGARAHVITAEAALRAGRATSNDAEHVASMFDIAVDGDSVVAARSLLVAAAILIELDELASAHTILERAGEPCGRAPAYVQIELATLHATLAGRQRDQLGAEQAAETGLRAFASLMDGVASYDVAYKAARHSEQLGEIRIRQLVARNDLIGMISILESIRARSLMLTPDTTSSPPMLEPADSYVVWCEVDGQLLALHQTESELTMGSCGSVEDIEQLVEAQVFAHRQLARRSSLSSAARTDLEAAASRADELVAEALLPEGVRDQVVLNPSSALADVVWGALPELDAKPHVIAPSLALAHRALPREITQGHAYGSSELAHVPDEVAAVAAIWSTTPHIDPAADVLSSMESTQVIHAAGHFVNDTNNPLLSAVPMGELRLRGYDYLKLAEPPAIAVLSACASGQGSTVGGAHVGFASAALAAGTAAVIVSQTLLEDSAVVAKAMERLHLELRNGTGPAEALRILRSEAMAEDRTVMASLKVVGAGWVR